jgi:hypothetical protein
MTPNAAPPQGPELNPVDAQMRAYVRAFASVLFPSTVLGFALCMTALVLA